MIQINSTLVLLKISLKEKILQHIILVWLINQPINHLDLEDVLIVMANLKIYYIKMDKQMDLWGQHHALDNILLDNALMEKEKELVWNTTKKEKLNHTKNMLMISLSENGEK